MKAMLIKVLSALLVVTITAGVAITGTLAFLTDRDSEANVFTVGDVAIDLEEDFNQGATLIPGVEIEKKPTITNTGKNDAWVWLEFAIPAALDNYVQGTEAGSNENVIHWNPKGATTEGYVTQERVDKAIAEGFFDDLDTTNLTAEYINNNKMHWNVFNSIATGENAYQTKIEVDGKEVDYNVYVLLYNKALTPGEETLPNIEKVFLDSRVDIDPEGNWNFVDGGNVTPIAWNSETNGNPIIYVSAYAMQTEGFATVQDAYAAYTEQWTTDAGENKGLEWGEVPVTVTSSEELAAAVAEGATNLILAEGEYKITGCAGKTLTINGSENAVIKVMNQGEDGCDYGFGSAGAGVGDITFNGVTIDTTENTGNYKGFAYMKGTFNNCNFVGAYSLNNANDFVFNNCTFDFKNGYFWTWGANSVTFDGCTFNGNSKAILAHGWASTVITINDCTFAATEKGYTGSGDNTAAVEIDPAGSNTYTINFTGENTKTDSYSGWTRIKDGSTGHTITGLN